MHAPAASDRTGVALGRRVGHRARRELDDERGRGEAGGSATAAPSRSPRAAAVRQPRGARVAACGRAAAAPGAHHVLRLVEPDRHRRPRRAGRGRGPGAPRARRTAAAPETRPARRHPAREVAVQVDAAPVPARSRARSRPGSGAGRPRSRLLSGRTPSRSRRVTAMPAHSSPWMQPTTSTRARPRGLPTRQTRSGRPPGVRARRAARDRSASGRPRGVSRTDAQELPSTRARVPSRRPAADLDARPGRRPPSQREDGGLRDADSPRTEDGARAEPRAGRFAAG